MPEEKTHFVKRPSSSYNQLKGIETMISLEVSRCAKMEPVPCCVQMENIFANEQDISREICGAEGK